MRGYCHTIEQAEKLLNIVDWPKDGWQAYTKIIISVYFKIYADPIDIIDTYNDEVSKAWPILKQAAISYLTTIKAYPKE